MGFGHLTADVELSLLFPEVSEHVAIGYEECLDERKNTCQSRNMPNKNKHWQRYHGIITAHIFVMQTSNCRTKDKMQRAPLQRGVAVPKKSDRRSVDSNFEKIPTEFLRKMFSYTIFRLGSISYSNFTGQNPKPAQIWSKCHVARSGA